MRTIQIIQAPSPDDRDFGDDVQEFGENVQTTLTDEWTKIYGGQCQNDDQGEKRDAKNVDCKFTELH